VPEPSVEMSPGQYIVKIDRASGEPQSDPIEPGELLVHATATATRSRSRPSSWPAASSR
jgi:hypothetical protein